MLKKNNAIVGKNIYNSNIYIETFNQNNVNQNNAKKCNFENCINKIKNITADQIAQLKPENKRIVMQLLH